MKIKLRKLFAVLFVFLLASCGSKEVSKENKEEKSDNNVSKEITIAIPDPQNSAIALATEEFISKVDEYSDGELKLNLSANGSLYGGDTAAGIKQLSSGSIDMLVLSSSVYSAFEPGFNMISVPYMFDDQKQLVDYLNSEVSDELFSRLEKMSIKPVGRWTRSFRQITNSKRPIKSVKDLEGLVLRVPNNSLYVEFFKSLGTVTTPMNFSEVYNALQLNTLDGQENPIDVPLSNNFYEVQKYLSFTNHMADAWVVGINSKLYDSLSDKQKQALEKAGDEVQGWNVDMMGERSKDALKELTDKGMESNELDEASLNEFVEASKKLYPEFRKLVEDDELFDKTIEFTGRN